MIVDIQNDIWGINIKLHLAVTIRYGRSLSLQVQLGPIEFWGRNVDDSRCAVWECSLYIVRKKYHCNMPERP